MFSYITQEMASVSSIFLFFIAQELASIGMILLLLLKSDHLKKRDTVEAKRIFNIAVLTAVGALLVIIIELYGRFMSAGLQESGGGLAALIPAAVLTCIKEFAALQVVIGWNMFIDYGYYKSYDHVHDKYKKSQRLNIVLFLIFILLYTINIVYIKIGAAVSVIGALSYLSIILQLYYVVNAIGIVRKAKKGRRPPSFLRLDVFIIPLALGYVLSFIPLTWDYDHRSLCVTLAILLTWRTVERRYKFIDPFTGFYNRNYLMSMNEYMEKTGSPNGIGIYFRASGSEGRLIPILDGLKPEDAELFSLGRDEYLLMAGPQKESVIRLLIKSVKLQAAEEGITDIDSDYAIRQEDESAKDFTLRLLDSFGEKSDT